ncbi:MAG: 50S ribosomal protein L31 [Elusimicrobia bacterium]|nr:50S ribosomal protein L31 [Elusimicrobiota bacterium]
MRAGIHPVYKIAKVICACGNTFETRSAKDVIKLEICSGCHPFYTGQQRLVDTAGRVERFKTRFSKTDGKMVVRKPVKREVKKLGMVPAPKPKVLSTAPKKETKADKKAAKKG